MSAGRRRIIHGSYDVGERKPIGVMITPRGGITFLTAKRGPHLHTTVERVYFSTLRTREMNRVRDRERAARRRLAVRKEASR